MFCKQRICDWLNSSQNMALFAAAISVSFMTSSANGQFIYDTAKKFWLGHNFQQNSTVIVITSDAVSETSIVGSCTQITSPTTIFKTDTTGFVQSPGPLTVEDFGTADVGILTGVSYLEVDADPDQILITMRTTAVGVMTAAYDQDFCSNALCLDPSSPFQNFCSPAPDANFLINEDWGSCPENVPGGGACENVDLFPFQCGNIMVPFTVTDYCNGKRSEIRLIHQNTFSVTDANTPQMNSKWFIVKPDGGDPDLFLWEEGPGCGVQSTTPMENSGEIDQAGFGGNKMTIPPGDYILVFHWQQVTLGGGVNAKDMTDCATPAQINPNVQVQAIVRLGISTCPCP